MIVFHIARSTKRGTRIEAYECRETAKSYMVEKVLSTIGFAKRIDKDSPNVFTNIGDAYTEALVRNQKLIADLQQTIDYSQAKTDLWTSELAKLNKPV